MNAFTRPSVDIFQPSCSTSFTSHHAGACQVSAANTIAVAALRFIVFLIGWPCFFERLAENGRAYLLGVAKKFPAIRAHLLMQKPEGSCAR
jgi:hypothetical protein